MHILPFILQENHGKHWFTCHVQRLQLAPWRCMLRTKESAMEL